jgi:hypothetical protein
MLNHYFSHQLSFENKNLQLTTNYFGYTCIVITNERCKVSVPRTKGFTQVCIDISISISNIYVTFKKKRKTTDLKARLWLQAVSSPVHFLDVYYFCSGVVSWKKL